MKKWILQFLFFASSASLAQTCFAEDLMTAYNQALQSDPTFKSAEADWLANEELNPISRSALFPTISSTAGANRSSIEQEVNRNNTNFFQTNKQLALNISQPIFDYKLWAGLKNANASVKQARANYDAARQNLMIRVATAYLAVLQAYDTLVSTEAQKESLAQQLTQTREQYKVGLVAVTNVEQVKANYDATVAQEIANKNTISDKLEELRAITGKFYTSIAGTKTDIPLVSPTPADINAWVDIAKKQNYTLQAANYGVVASRANIEIERAGHFPTVNATGGYTYEHDSSAISGQVGEPEPNTNKTGTVGVAVNFPIFQGGLVSAQTKQAAYQYASTSATAEDTYRTTLTQARESYLAVISGISKLQADKQAIVSNQISLNATQAGYTAGNNTIIDVLNQVSSLYSARTTYTTDEYNYLSNILNLKQAAGTLSSADLAQINAWFNYNINLAEYNFNTPDKNSATAQTAAINSSKPAVKHSHKRHKHTT